MQFIHFTVSVVHKIRISLVFMFKSTRLNQKKRATNVNIINITIQCFHTVGWPAKISLNYLPGLPLSSHDQIP